MEKGQLLLAVIELILLLLPIGALIWKASAQAGVIKELEKNQSAIEKRVDKIEERNEKAIEEIKESLKNLAISFARIETALELNNKTKEGN